MPVQSLMMVGTYDFHLVALSIFIAILASYAALDLAGRVTSAHGGVRMLWLSGGSVAMGIGIWSMHYIGMLAFHLPIPVQYDWIMVLVSLVAAIFASAVALFVVSRSKMGLLRAMVGSIFMGSGIAAMHYVGMAAMRLSAMCHYSSSLVTLSAVLAIVISFVALWLAFHFRGDTTAGGWLKTLSALVMGAAIPVMHYTGMAAVSFSASTLDDKELAHAVSISSLGIAGIIVVTLMVLGLVLITSLLDRRFSVQALELESSEQRYRQIVEAAFDGFVGMDSNGLITDWNEQARTTFGWSRSDAVGKHLSELIDPNYSRDANREDLRHFLGWAEGPVLNKRTEITALHRSGRKFPVELAISEIHTGKTQSFAAFARDITERKRVEEEREQAKTAAEAASRAKSEFLANMSHEIRTPLNGVMGMTDLVLETELSDEQREYLETVKMSADSLLTVINDILDFSKIEAGKIDLEVIDFNIRDSLEGTLKTLAFRADEKGLELLCEVAPEVPEAARGDSGRLRQIVVNLVSNALKFTAEGEVVLKVQIEAIESDHHILHFTVSDTGIGIPLDKQKLIFEPFSQADTSTTRRYGGTGLGLTISLRFVEMMGGKLWVESEVGRGTQFHFTVRLETSRETIDKEKVALPDVLRGVKVLVVDDNRTNRRILEGMLKRWEMSPTAVESAEKALVELALARDADAPYALILTDMHMPAMDGFGLIEVIRQSSELSTATIMMLTSAGHRGDATRCQDLGVAGYLLKPIRQSELREAIARVLGAQERKEAIPLITRFSVQDARDPTGILRVLLAEDNAVNQRLATRLLEKRGHHVVVTGNGREALAALEKEPFDLVLMDVQMPEMDGLEATAALRAKETGTGAHLWVIALTAHAMKGDRERCIAAGMDGYLSKPIRPPELDEMLQNHLNRRMESAMKSQAVGNSQ